MKLNKNKTPGPDGLSSGFFKESWAVMGKELMDSVHHFFIYGFLPSAANATILALIPKIPGASSIADYRPISPCNTIYKVISKLLVARIKPIIPKIILPNQTAFVKGRLLIENTLLASELVQGYHKEKGPKRSVLKVDIAKAFDTVRWEFLFGCLRCLNISEDYIRWLEACVCTTSFSVGYNGPIHGYFKGKRGLRQGDPLSPYLVVITMNCLSYLLNNAAAEGKMAYHHKCHVSKLTNLCFADDLLIFTDGSLRSVQNILHILKEFEEKSGLAVSIQKTSFFSVGLSVEEIDQIHLSLGIAHDS